MKVKAISASNHRCFVDDKGRIWIDYGRWEHPIYSTQRKWLPKWKQLDLPEEPES